MNTFFTVMVVSGIALGVTLLLIFVFCWCGCTSGSACENDTYNLRHIISDSHIASAINNFAGNGC